MSVVAIAILFVSVAGQGPNARSLSGPCKSECSASIRDGYKCDRCSTGTLSSDLCTYPGNATFEASSFQTKDMYFWQKIIQDRQRLGAYPSVLGILSESSQTSFYNWGDEMPKGRQKLIHSIGVICSFKIENAPHSPYTGLFEPGQQEGFIRLGSAVDYSNGGLTPGLGIKFARTGVHSGNYVALHSLDFGQSWNFFASNLSNHIPPPSGLQQGLLVKKFNQASNCPTQVGLSDMARYSQNGTKHDHPIFPFKLFLVPSQAVQTPATIKTVDQVNAEMEAFPVGTTLYTVYACGKAADDETKPTDGGMEKACASSLKLGAMVTTQKCTASTYGDKSFHIRHQPVEEDWQADPSILEQAKYDANKACGWNGKSTSTSLHDHPPVSPPSICGKKASIAMRWDDATIV